jgi:hypothetical protein
VLTRRMTQQSALSHDWGPASVMRSSGVTISDSILTGGNATYEGILAHRVLDAAMLYATFKAS